jgi:polysaccharide biosynthesis protein PslG
MLRHNDAGTKIYITEFGWNDHPRWTLAVRPGQRIQNTLDAFTYAEENWPYVEMIAIWAFRLPAPTKSYMDNFTLVTPEFVTKPIYTELQRFTGNE